jgi:hypothetical protein
VYADTVSERTAALTIAPFDKYSVNTLSRGYTHSSVLAWRIPGTEEPGGTPRGCKELDLTEQLTHTRAKYTDSTRINYA